MKKFVPVWLAMLAATVVLTLAPAPTVGAQNFTYGFNLDGPQAESNGTQTIELTGAGSFDSTADTVVASGSFQITNNSTGAVVLAGTWKATTFDSFCARGGPSPGFQGGVLVITVTLFPKGRDPVTGVVLTVTCRIGKGCNAGEEGVTVEGVTGFNNFTTRVGGHTLFHLN